MRNERVGQPPRAIRKAEHEELVAQRIQARGLEPDDGSAARDVRRERGHDAPSLLPRLVDQAGGEIGAAAAQRPRG